MLVAPILVILGLLHFSATPPAPEAYSVRRWALGLSIVFLVGPAASGCAAYIVSRLKNADIFARRWKRERLILPRALGTTLGVSTILVVGFGIYQAGFSLPDPRLFLVALMALLQMLAWGAIAALLLPSLLAVPLALVGGYMWMVFLMTVEPLWLRHLNGYWPTCCTIDQVPSLHGAMGVTLVAFSAWIGAYGLLVKKLHKLRAVLSFLICLAMFSGSLFSVHHLEADPVEPRVSGLSCSPLDGNGELCLFKEHEKYREHAEQFITQMSKAWGDVVPVGQVRYSESSYETNALLVDFSPKRREEEVAMLAQAHLPPFPQCNNLPYENGQARDAIYEALVILGGVAFADPQEQVKLILSLDQTRKEHWFTDMVDRAQQCSAASE